MRLVRGLAAAAGALLLLGAAFSAAAYTSPGKPAGYVNDFAGILPEQQRQALEAELSAFEKETSHEVAVVTVPSLGDETIESYSIRLAEEWKVGKKDKDNGAILLVAPNERKVRIEVGYGLEGALPDATAHRIIEDRILPRFRAGDYPGGVQAGVSAILAAARGEVIPEPKPSATSTGSVAIGLFVGLFALVHMAFMGLGLFPRTRSWWLGGIVGAFYGLFGSLAFGSFLVGIPLFIAIGLGLDFLYSRYIKVDRGSLRRGGWFGGGGGGSWGGGSSSGGSFGGGSFGGGGSSGSW